MIEHDVILQMLKDMGFDEVWLGWIKILLSSGQSAVLLNGVPGKNFKCVRGVRQDDPLSPLLFVLAADLLQAIINKEHQMRNLDLPIPKEGIFSIIRYAEDTILVLLAEDI